MTRVLIAPAAARFAAGAGSENGWVYDVVAEITKLDEDLHVTCVAEEGEAAGLERVELLTIGRRRSEEIGGALLPLRIARAIGHSGALDDADLVHHALPFAIGRTYSVLRWMATRRGLPFVLGPVQSPLEWAGADELRAKCTGNGRGVSQRASSALAWFAGPAVAAPLRRISADTLRGACRVVVISERVGAMVEAQGVAQDRIRVIPPPVRLPGADPVVRHRPTEGLKVVTAGYLIQRKAVDSVALAVARLAASGFRITLDILGEGPAGQDLRHLVRSLPGSEAIRFHGWVARSRVDELLRASHVYVSMSRAESWGQAVCEALAVGTVVVSADNVGARSLVAINAPVHLVPLGATSELERYLAELCGTDPALLARMGEAGTRWAQANIGVSVIARRWRDVYREAVADPVGTSARR
jgi:glycosyltransferase involved in cell wall biosynthesis